MTKIVIQVVINAPAEQAWKLYTEPEHIMKWNSASGDWHTPKAENDLRIGGKFFSRMEAKDGSTGFDFSGTYDHVKANELIEYTMSDGRKAKTTFAENDGKTEITITFDAESTNSIEVQRNGWQAILDSFKKYVDDR
jgi:uncharacterized protein YndB with AHSA1/START domain